MARILDTSVAGEVRDIIAAALDEAGFSPEEAIPGLVGAIYDQAQLTRYEEQALDEAANLLADGGD